MRAAFALSIALAVAAIFGLASVSFPGQNQQAGLFFLQGQQAGRQLTFEERRGNILNELSEAINDAKLEGKYGCCIEPPCTMCYLGEWIWDDGYCRCDEMIAKGEFDKVCPQCKKGLEEGKCVSGTGKTEECLLPEDLA
ncbi:MAG: hypothetical protein WC634_01855 [archaeon]